MARRNLLLTAALVALVFAAPGLSARAEGTNEPAPGGIASTGGGSYIPPSDEVDRGLFAEGDVTKVPVVLDKNGNPPPPPTLFQLEHIKKETVLEIQQPTDKNFLPFDIRAASVKEAALSYGARGGMAWRTYQVRADLENRAHYSDKVFDFRQLLIPAPSGLMIEPPIVSEQQKAMLIESGGAEAAVADRIYDITAQAKIVGAPRSWRNYLERDWDVVDPPPDILRPNDDKERKIWIEQVDKGWALGLQQADLTFQDDLARLTSDYQGMIRYRVLLAQGIITPPYTLQTDRGVTGGGKKMRVGDRDVQITGMPELVPGSEKWRPASQ